MANGGRTALTVRAVETKKPGKYADGGRSGLWLNVSPTGARRWFVRVVIDGKRREMSLGTYPLTSLADAREKALDAQKLARRGQDPIKTRNQNEIRKTSTPTFTSCAAKFIRSHRRGWRNKKHARQWVSTLKTYARPTIGNVPVDRVETEEILAILTPLWTQKTETAKRVQGRIENILDFAAARKWREPINPARWRGHLDKLLPKPSKVTKVQHFPAMDFKSVPAFMTELEVNESFSSLALQLLILTATRTSEVLRATWTEFDLESSVWTLAPERMKGAREHKVPLSNSAMTILSNLPRIEGNPFVFPGARHGRPLSNMALLQLMRGMGYGAGGNRGAFVPHGFRSSFRDWSGEVSSFPRDIAEMALAHAIKDKTEAAYRRGDLLNKRRLMMQEWADWCTKPKDKIVPVNEAKKVAI